MRHETVDEREAGFLSGYSKQKTWTFIAQKDHNQTVHWNPFATSHGISARDCVGSPLKSLATKANAQRPHDGQIQTSQDLSIWTNRNVRSLKLTWMPNSSIQDERTQPVQRFAMEMLSKETQLHHFKQSTVSTFHTGLHHSSTKKFWGESKY